MKTLIVDDERLNRELISTLLIRVNDNFEVIGLAENIDEAYELILSCSPDIIFLDVKMPGGSGFDLLQRFVKPNFEVVFITGFDEYAIKAFEFNAIDYVLKPIDLEKFKKTLDKVCVRLNSKLSVVNNLKEILEIYDTKDLLIKKIPIHNKDKVELIDVSDVFSVNADSGYTVFKTINNGIYISSRQLSSFEFILDKFSFFIKISKGIYINTNYIKNYTKSQNCLITLKNNEVFEVSRRKKTEILALLDLTI